MNATYADVRDYAGWLDLSDWGLVRVIGSDRQRFLQAQTTNDLRPLQEGMGLYTAFCTPTGHLLTDAYLLEAEGSYLLLLPPATFGAMLERLSQLIILDEVELIPLQEGLGVLSVQGSCADEVLEEIGLEPPPAGELRHHARIWQKTEVRLVRCPRTLWGGYDLILPFEAHEEMKTALVATGVLPIPPELHEVMRYEAGIPLYGVDMDERTLAPEMGAAFITKHISYTKGCYTGQEVLMRIRARGHTNRTWVPLHGGSDPQVCPDPSPSLCPALRGARVMTPDPDTPKEVGWITGAVRSPQRNGNILAWGFVRNAYIAPGTHLQIQMEPTAEAPSTRFLPAVVLNPDRLSEKM
jgi:tRNA-modifying protein YgfZ